MQFAIHVKKLEKFAVLPLIYSGFILGYELHVAKVLVLKINHPTIAE